MNEEDKDIDVESDEVPEVGQEATATTSNSLHYRGEHLDKRAHHNALERRRRDHIKDSFHGLRDCIPAMEGEKVSRAHILNKATEYIRHMQKGGLLREEEISELKENNEVLEEQVRALEQARTMGSSASSDEILQTVAQQCQSRQQQQNDIRSQQPVRTQGGNAPNHKTGGEGVKDGGKATGQATVSRPPPTTPTGQKTVAKSQADGQLNLNLLTSNLKTAQSLITALQKSTGGNLPANVKSLAARVLASPLRTQTTTQQQQQQSIPRGIVTATTVANQTSLPTNLAGILQKQLSGTSPPVATKTSPRQQLKTEPSTTPATSVSSNVASVKSTVSAATPSAAKGASSSPQTQQIASSLLSSQILAASSLLKQSSGETDTSSSVTSPDKSTLSANHQLASELLAQVTSFLNLPNPAILGTGNTTHASDGDEMSEGEDNVPDQTPQDVIPQQNSSSTSPQTIGTSHTDEKKADGQKRAAPHELDSVESSCKKPRIGQ